MEENEAGEIINIGSKRQLITNERCSILTKAVLGSNVVSQEAGRAENSGSNSWTSISLGKSNSKESTKTKK